jgi:fission 1 protein
LVYRRKYNEELLTQEPDNLQSLSLRKLIKDKVERDSLIGMALAGGAVAAVGIALAAIFRTVGPRK